MVRLAPLVLGLLAVGAGAALTAGGGDPLPTKWLQDAALLVVAICVAGVAVVGLLVRALESDGERPVGGDAFGPSVRTPGDDVDERITGAGGLSRGTRADLRDRFETAAVAALVRERGWTPDRARDALAAGTWTDDPVAAAFFTDDPPAPGLVAWLRAVVGGESTFRRRAERASVALFGGER